MASLLSGLPARAKFSSVPLRASAPLTRNVSSANPKHALFQPLKLGAVTLKNRVLMSALTRNRSIPTNIPNSVNLEYYKQRAVGGAGLIVTEGTLITPQGTEWPNAPGIWSKEHVKAWRNITNAVHSEGSKMFMQLWHLGRVNHPDMPEQKASGEPVYGPSAVAAAGGKFRQLPGEPGYVTPTPIDDPWKLIELYKKAAINAKEAGFDGVELHGANGYLVHQFLDSTSNKRTDAWGGSVENRARFGIETLKTLISVWGNDRVAIRLSPAGGYNDMGMPLEETKETFSHFITEADKLDLAYIALVRYLPAMDPTHRATVHDVIGEYTPLITVPTKKIGNGLFTPEEAAEKIEAGQLDAVMFGVPWLGHPDLANRIKHSRPLDNELHYQGFYQHDGTLEGARKGYTDYPAAKYD